MKKLFLKFFAIIMLCLALIPRVNIYADYCRFYVKRNNEHKQPTIDTNYSFIEECGGIYVDKKHSDNSSEKVIYLTFDVGYENGNVEKILNVMKNEGVVGSFFILENVINREPNLVLRMANEGHLVCNHTSNHPNLVGKSQELCESEIKGLEEVYKNLTKKELSKFFRPPEGSFDKELLLRVKKMGYTTVFWSFAYADWDNSLQMSEEKALKKILDNIHNGEIMLLHPTSSTNAKIMQRLIRELKSQGYRFATLDEL